MASHGRISKRCFPAKPSQWCGISPRDAHSQTPLEGFDGALEWILLVIERLTLANLPVGQIQQVDAIDSPLAGLQLQMSGLLTLRITMLSLTLISPISFSHGSSELTTIGCFFGIRMMPITPLRQRREKSSRTTPSKSMVALRIARSSKR